MPREPRRRPSCPRLGSSSSNYHSILHPPSSPLPRKRRGSYVGYADDQDYTYGQSRSLVVQWVLDTRNLWPAAQRTAQLIHHAKDALDLLPSQERVEVLKYVHVRDAKMALGSRLLKRYLITRYANVPWDEANMTRNADTKPVFIAPDGSEPIVFNVSHQAGIVVLVAAYHPPEGAAVGVDIVCPTERRERDHLFVRNESWQSFVDMHGEVLCPNEVTSLCSLPFRDLDHRLRYFYTLWCLREAYVKMTGEALLAPWLRRLEMRYFTPPEDAPVEQIEVWFQGKCLDEVDLYLANVMDDFMICTVSKKDSDGNPFLDVGEYEKLDIDEVIAFGTKAKAQGSTASLKV